MTRKEEVLRMLRKSSKKSFSELIELLVSLPVVDNFVSVPLWLLGMGKEQSGLVSGKPEK